MNEIAEINAWLELYIHEANHIDSGQFTEILEKIQRRHFLLKQCMEAETLTAEQLAKEQDFNTLLHAWFEQIRNSIQNELIEMQKSKIGLTKYKQVKDA